jgi:hypothetical protein
MTVKCAATLTLSLLTGVALAPLAMAQQQTTGTPGSPSATTTIDGKYIPNAPPKFGGARIRKSIRP